MKQMKQMKQATLTQNRVTLLIIMMTILPYQPTNAHSALAGSGNVTEEIITTPLIQVDTRENQSADETEISQNVWIGIGAAAAVVVGAVALNDSDSDGDDAPSTPEPPTADSLVDAWSVAGEQPGSGRSYSGIFYLYQGGFLGYELSVSDGRHLTGGGSWNLQEYTLQVRTDHGSTYRGTFQQGREYDSIELTSDTAWIVTMTR